MCIRFCDDGNSSGCEKAVAAMRYLGMAAVVSFLQYEGEVEVAIPELNRDDTLEYLRWYPANWMSREEFSEFASLLDWHGDVPIYKK